MFSPKGNLHQADYALKAVNRAKPSIGICTNEGEVFDCTTSFGKRLMICLLHILNKLSPTLHTHRHSAM
jgi:20S proteasome alpha/beta subunit